MTIPPFDHSHPVELHFGCGALADAGAIVAGIGRRVFLCVDAFFAASGLADKLTTGLRQSGCTVVGQTCIAGEPEAAAIDDEAERSRPLRCDVVLAVGGGSTIDFAKALALGLTNEGSVWDYTNAVKPKPRPVANPVVPLLAVPTTAGSGSEMSAIAVIANRSLGLKSTIVSPALYPRAAVVDPELTASVPPQVRMMTAMDALAHGFENFLNVGSPCEIHRVVGLEAVRRIAPHLDGLATEEVGLDVLAEVALGSSLAGWANAFGTTGAAGAIAQSFGASLHIPHAAAVACVLPEVLENTWPAIPDAFASAASAFGIEPTGPAESLCRKIVDWWRSRRCVSSARRLLDDAKPGDLDVDALAAQIVDTMQRPLDRHPARFTRQDIGKMIRNVREHSP